MCRLLLQSPSIKAMIWHEYVMLLIVGYDDEDKLHDYSIYDYKILVQLSCK